MKTQNEIQKEILLINKQVNKTNVFIESRGLFGDYLYSEKERTQLKNAALRLETKRNELSHAKRLIARMERIQRLENMQVIEISDGKTLKEIAIEFREQAREMVKIQESKISGAVLKSKEKKQAIREATQFYNQEINAINYILNEQ